MASRQYTVEEIIRMREVAQEIARHSPIVADGVAIEAQLRTYMDNGTEPDDLDTVANRLKWEDQG